jgi:hypothetical protein
VNNVGTGGAANTDTEKASKDNFTPPDNAVFTTFKLVILFFIFFPLTKNILKKSVISFTPKTLKLQGDMIISPQVSSSLYSLQKNQP